MAEHDFIIDNGTGSVVRTDLNNLFQAIASNNSKSGALTTIMLISGTLTLQMEI